MNYEYVTLMTSLPHLYDPFVWARPPISEVQLRKRTRMLSPEDRALLRQVRKIVYWGGIDIHMTDEALVSLAKRVCQSIENEQMLEWLMWRLDFRTLISAMRRRAEGDPAPLTTLSWGVGRYTHLIAKNWSHPTFNLQGRFPWLITANTLLQQDHHYELEKLLLQTAWNYLGEQTAKRPYSLEAFFLYLAKWDLVNRWCSYQSKLASERFNLLLKESLSPALAHLDEKL